MDPILTHEVEGYRVNVELDQTPTFSPRDEYDNLGTFFGFHGRYRSPDTPPDSEPAAAARIACNRDNLCLPVWLYDHSGTSYRAAEKNPFHCPWDSGLFGFVYVSKAKVRAEYGVKRITAKTRQKALDVLASEVRVYSDWANGNVYCYRVIDPDGEEVDSCFGFIGDAEGALQEGASVARAMAGVAPYVPIQTGKGGNPVYVAPPVGA